jgi:hypothetical protein
MTIALPISRLLADLPPGIASPAAKRQLGWAAAGVASLVLVVLAGSQARFETEAIRVIGPIPAAVDRIIPPGACVLTDQVSVTLLANRFESDVPGCPQMVDSLATDLALSNGKKPQDGAGYVPAVATLWRQAFAHAQLVLLSPNNVGRVPWTPALRAYFTANFVQLHSPWKRVTLYKHRGFDLKRAQRASKHR